jgi:D-xylose transport system permease protein
MIHARGYAARVTSGELGTLPAFAGLIFFSCLFAVLSPHFLSAANLANLFTQGAAVSVIAMGLVFVLLLGEIDLSVGAAAGLCGAVLAVTLRDLPVYAALPMALLTGTMIGLGLGLLISKSGIPPVVVTLAALLGLQGVTLILLHDGEIVPVNDTQIVALVNNNFSPGVSWLIWAGGVGAYALLEVRRKHRGSHHRAASEPTSLTVWRVAVAGVVSAVIVQVLNLERSPNPDLVSLRGVPVVVPVIAALIVGWSFVLRRTAFGRRLSFSGADRERAVREGVDINRLRISAYAICSTLAAIGGVIAVSRAHSADPNTGGVNVLLSAVAAAVIGGSSLFGGKGRVQGAVLGAAVVAVVDNGLSQVTHNVGLRYLVICLLVLLAAGIDVAAHRRVKEVEVAQPRYRERH